MSLIKERKKGRKDGGYTRIFGVSELGSLLSQTHATTIASGKEVEKMLWDIAPNKIQDLDAFIEERKSQKEPKKAFIVNEHIAKKSKILASKKKAPDFMVFLNKNCYSIEMKDGDAFDTKKSKGELSAMREFHKKFTNRNIPYKHHIGVCCFNATTKKQVRDAFKNEFEISQCMTGREFCTFVGMGIKEFDEIVEKRKKDAPVNLSYFIKRLLCIPQITNRMKRELKKGD